MIKDKNRFYFHDEEGTSAEILFTVNENILRITSTKTRSDQRGKGLAEILTDAVVEYAISNNYKIIPICSYAIKYFEKNIDLSYLLVK